MKLPGNSSPAANSTGGSPDDVVFVIDHDAASREAICTTVRSLNLRAAPLASADEFLETYRGESGCVVADIFSPGAGGDRLQDELARRDWSIPLIALTVQPLTRSIVRALKRGAETVLDKPPEATDLKEALRDCLSLDVQRRRRRDNIVSMRRRLGRLTDKEREVLHMIVAGRPNKAIANHLRASLRTVENRRREIFQKLEVRSVAELVTVVLTAEGTRGFVAADL